jgi:hypothetical protein
MESRPYTSGEKIRGIPVENGLFDTANGLWLRPERRWQDLINRSKPATLKELR